MVLQRVAGERRLCMLKGWKYKIIRNIDEMIKAIWKTLLLILYLMQNVFICVIRMLVCLQAWRQTQRIRLGYESRR